jgi:hypothetical protein
MKVENKKGGKKKKEGEKEIICLKETSRSMLQEA